MAALYNFTGRVDGYRANGGLIFDKSGALYGTTPRGQEKGLAGFAVGTVFKLTPPAIAGGVWGKSVLHSFTAPDGQYPSVLILDKSGALYGTTAAAGIGCSSYGCGTVFELTPPSVPGGVWTYTLLHSFTGGADGSWPKGGLIFDKSGALYGTTQNGGTGCSSDPDGCGTVFKLTPPPVPGGVWTKRVLYSFTDRADGAYPNEGLIFDESGALYGTTFSTVSSWSRARRWRSPMQGLPLSNRCLASPFANRRPLIG